MKIKLSKEGGFMGMISNTDLEYDKLSEDEQHSFDRCVSALISEKAKTGKKKTAKPVEITPSSDDHAENSSHGSRGLDLETKSDLEEISALENEEKSTDSEEKAIVSPLLTAERGLEDAQVTKEENQMRDGFSYTLKVKKGLRWVTLQFDDKNIPDELFQLFQKHIQY
jgi:hypothetical protein